MAGGDASTAIRLGASMTALQASIGTLNDLVDAPLDAGRSGKPLAAGTVAPSVARVVAVAMAATGLALAVPSGPVLVLLAITGLAIGYGYDLRARGTAWSWLPFAIGIPLLPAYGWYGAVGTLPAWFVVLAPMASIAGAAIAVANACADLESDAAAGAVTVATALGEERSRWVGAGAWLVVAIGAIGSLLAAGAATTSIIAVVAGISLTGVGVGLGWRTTPNRRRRAWEIQAIGAAIAAVAWVLAVA